MNSVGARQPALHGALIFQVVFPSLVLIRLKVLCTSGEELQAWAGAGAIVCRALFFMLKGCQDFPVSLLGCLGCSNCAWVKHHANLLALANVLR